jgi:hypothetical protein
VAVLYGTATYLAGQAAGYWDDATRAEVRWSVGFVETVRHVYGDQAPAAFAVAESEVRAAVLGDQEGTPLVDAEAATAATFAEQLRFQSRTDAGVLGDEYALEGGGFDLNQRLADELSADDMPRHVTSGLLDRGDDAAQQAVVIAWIAVVIVGAFLLGRAKWRRTAAAARVPDVGLIPEPTQIQLHKRPIAYAALAAWALVSVLPAAQIGLDARSNRAGSDASRQSVELSTHLIGGQLASSMQIGAQQSAIRGSQRALARQLAAVETGDGAQRALGAAELRAADAWVAVLARMIRPPTTDDGFGAEAISALRAGPADWNRLVSAQNDSVERSTMFGRASGFIALAMVLAALAGIIASAAAVSGRLDRHLWPSTVSLLAASCLLVMLAGSTILLG